MLVRVLVESWQIECCGEPVGVGDHVSWQLMALPVDPLCPEPGEGPLPGEFRQLGPALVPDGSAIWMIVHRGLTAQWQGPDPAPGVATPECRLAEDHHVNVLHALPRTQGVVRRVQVVTRLYRRPAERGRDPLRVGPDRLTEVARSPKWFEHPQTTDGEYAFPVGALVELELDDD